MIDIFQVFATHGVWIGVSTVLASFLGAYVRRDWKRLDHVEKRLECIESQYRELTSGLLRDCQKTLEATNSLLTKFLLKD